MYENIMYSEFLLIQGCVKMFPPKTRADVGMVQCVSRAQQTTWRKNRRNKEEGRSMQRRGQLVHAKPRSLTFANFEYICTIPTSGNILLCHLLLHTHSGYSASCLHLQVQPYNSPISLLCCAPSSLNISTRFSTTNCLLLNHLCCTCSRI